MTDFAFTEKHAQDATQCFHLFDKRGDETIATKDLGQAFKSLGVHFEGDKLKEWSDDYDEEATGFMSLEQFKLMYERKLKEDHDEKELKDAFKILDKGNRGVIDVKDLRWILTSLDPDLKPEEIEDMITETDTDGSGTVDYEEFKNLMSSE